MKHKNGKVLLKFFAWMMIILLVIWVSLIFWLGPFHVKARLIDDISKFWDGPVKIDGIDFRFFHPITARHVILENKAGKPCVEAKGMTLLFKEWPSQNPQLTGIAVDHLDVIIQFEEGTVDLPFKKTTSSSSDQHESPVTLNSFTVGRLLIALSNATDTAMLLNDLTFSAIRQQSDYAISLKQRCSSDPVKFSLSGDIGFNNSKVNLSLEMAQHIEKCFMGKILSLFELPFPFEFESYLSADMDFKGMLGNLDSLQPTGTIMLKKSSIIKNRTVWAQKLNANVQIKGSDIHIEKFTAESFEGQIEGCLDAVIKKKKLAQFQGYITGKDIQASGFIRALTDIEKSSEGVLTFDYTFAAGGGNLKKMKGQGSISLEQIDYEIMPVVQRIIRTVSRNDMKAQKNAYAIGNFEIEGSTATFRQARLANDWVAIEALPGGILDLETNSVEGYVIVAPIKQISEELHGIPIVNLFARLTDHLTCLRVKGNCSDVSHITITKEPLRDVTKGTLDFFQGVADTGSGFMKEIVRTSGELSNDN